MSTLKQTEKVRPLSERGVYAYPVNRFSRDASDEDILSDYMRIVPTMKIRSGNIPLKNFCLASTTRALIVWTIGFV